MSDDLHDELLAAFREEQREHLDAIRKALAALEGAGVQTGGADLEEAFRRAHSLKAAARVCDLGPPAALGQRLEALFSRMRQGTIVPNAENLGIARQVVDAGEKWANAWEAGQTPPEPIGVLEAVDRLLASGVVGWVEFSRPTGQGQALPVGLEDSTHPTTTHSEGLDAEVLAAFQVEHREHLERIRSLLTHIEASGGGSEQVDEVFRRAHSLKGAARIAGLKPAETVAHRLETLFAKAREGSLHVTPVMVQAIQRGLNFIEDAAVCLVQQRPMPDPSAELAVIDAALGVLPVPADIGSVREGEAPAEPEAAARQEPRPPEPGLHPGTAQPADAVRVSADHLDRLLQTAEQVLTEGLGQDRSVRELALLQREADDLVREWELAGTAIRARQHAGGNPDLDRIHRLLHQVGERLRALARHARQTHRLHRQSSWALRVLGRQLQHDVRQARTVPAEGVFQGFRKMMRDLAQTDGKDIDFRMTGLDVKADRLVLQGLKDSLMHVLRNAVCHGIQPPDERRRQGKPPAGRVSLHLEVVGNLLHVIVEDDGQGIDPRKLAEEAVRRRILTSDEAEAADAEKLTRLVFQPGFSTSRVVTDLSGRGMGLSVVQEAVTRLQGEVNLSRNEFGGTRVGIVVPLSVSAQRLLLVTTRGQTLAIAVHSVERLCRIKPHEIEMVSGQPVLILENEPIPLRTLAQLLGLEGEETARDLLSVVVVRSGPRRLAVIVESLLGERDALLKDLGPPANRGERWAGAILLEDASVCLVLNAAALFRDERTERGTGAVRFAAPPALKSAEKKTPTILVVDDSLTTRTLEKSILEAHGYRVRLALDGLEALTQLRSDLPDLVITDIQMPRLDGFGLLEQMKKDPRLARLPVIVVTSLERREDQERGLALGADAYIVKRKFDHEELLQTVQQIL